MRVSLRLLQRVITRSVNAAATSAASVEPSSTKKLYSLTPMVNRSTTLRRLVDLGVDLAKVEAKENAGSFLARLHFEEDVEPRLRFLASRAFMNVDKIGEYLTHNPWVLQQDLDDLNTRINYLEFKGFSNASIARIVLHAIYWLNMGVMKIDERLKFYQTEFRLNDEELRYVVTKHPMLITFGTGYTQFLQFAFEEQMGFSKDETRTLLIKDPKLWTTYKEVLVKSFNYLHNEMGLSHNMILTFPLAMRVHSYIVRDRHEFLKQRNLNQYDPEKPNYVPLRALTSGVDEVFCKTVARCSVRQYNEFLKSR